MPVDRFEQFEAMGVGFDGAPAGGVFRVDEDGVVGEAIALVVDHVGEETVFAARVKRAHFSGLAGWGA